MRVTLHRTDEIYINLEWIARSVIKLIGSNIKEGWHKSLEELVGCSLKGYCCGTSYDLAELTSYDNYTEVLQTVINSMIVWCAENDPFYYGIIMEYKKSFKQ